ncbi:MAG TPA: DUF3352 domain-containing protein [Solirubrobacterales bacterium]
MRSRTLLVALAATALTASTALFASGCGESSDGSKVAELAPPGVPVFVEGTVRPEGELKADTDAIAEQVGGIENLGEFVVSELESSAQEDGEPFDYATEVEPWLGERAAVFFERLDEDDDLAGLGMILESTDTAATQEFVDTQVEVSKEPYRSRSYEGVEYEVGGDEEEALGVVGDFLALGEDEKVFKEIVDASAGEALAGEDTFVEAIGAASDGSLADVYVDVGKLVGQSGGQIDPQARQILQNAGIDPSEATAVASIVPGDGQIAIELSSDLAGQEAPSGDASELLGSLPADAFAGLAVSGFGSQVKEAIDALDKEGIPDAVPPNQLKKGLGDLGIDLEGLADSLRDGGAFAVGTSEDSLGGALVLTTEGNEAVEAVTGVIKLLRGIRVEGVTVLGGKYTGFSVRSDDLGDKPLVVVAEQGRLVIGYGLPAALQGLRAGEGQGGTLSADADYQAAVDSLGGTTITGFADGTGALRLADALIPASDEDFEEAKRYLKSIRFLALGSAEQDELATAKLIVGLK